jgi:hypothetical protein
MNISADESRQTAFDVNAFADALAPFGIPRMTALMAWRAENPFVVTTLLAMCARKRVMPTSRDKIPLVKAWQTEASADPEKIARWRIELAPRSWSVLTGRANGLVVLDIDGERGRADLARLETELGPLPTTWRVNSGRVDGGEHVWLQIPTGEDDARNQQPLPGFKIDVRGWHGHVIVPGSKHKSGNRYRWVEGCAPDECELATCPEAWWSFLPKKETASTVKQPRSTMPSARRARGVVRKPHDSASEFIGDGEGAGGFNRPIRVRCCQFWARGGTDARVEEFKAVLRNTILKADSSNHSPEQVARYASDVYLSAELASAKEWINSQAQ